MAKARFAALAVAATLVLAACGDDDTTSPVGPPASVAAVSGNNQTGVAGEALADPIAVRVTDADGRAVSDVDVVFAVTVGGGDVSTAVAGGLAADVPGPQLALAVTVATDADGEAAATWTLGTTAGDHEATATVAGVDPITFTATAGPDVPDAVSLVSGDAQEGLVGADLADDLVVEVTDQYGNLVSNATVDWAVTSGDASFAAATSATDASGLGSNTLTLGQTTGEIEATATVGTLTPVTFTALAKAEISDPAGDEFSTSASAGLVPPDITRMTVWREGGELRIELEFVDDVVSGATGGPNVVVGYVDIDTDQNAGTGATTYTDANRPGAGSTGMGMDYYLSMFPDASGDFEVYDFNDTLIGAFTPTFDANLLSMAVPLSLLGDDDGILYLATVVGTGPEPTDIAPEDGNLSTGPAPAPVAGITSRSKNAGSSPRPWRRR